MLNRHLRPPGLVFKGYTKSTPSQMPSSKTSTTSSNSLPTTIHASPSTSRPDEMVSLVSDVEEEFTTPPCQPSPNQFHQQHQRDVRFYVESVNETQQNRQKNSVPNSSNAQNGSRKHPIQSTVNAFVAASSKALMNGGSAPASNTLSSSGSTAAQIVNQPLARTSLPGSFPRGLDSMAGHQQNSQQPYPNNPFGFHDMPVGASHMYPRNASTHNVPLGFDHHSHLIQSHPHQYEPLNRFRGELAWSEKYQYDLSRAQLKASSRTSALLAGFAMVALVELQYEKDTPHWLLILLGVVTTLLVSVHLLSLMISTCLLPYIEATGCTQDSPHIRLGGYIELSWVFSTCIGLILFLLEIVIIFVIKFKAIGFDMGGYITTAMLAPVLIVFAILSWLIHKERFSHSVARANDKVDDLEKFIDENALHHTESKGSNLPKQAIQTV